MTTEANLDRFIIAQNNVYENVIVELKAGLKVGHWMWFIFPQISGLGSSSISQYYSIKSEEEAIGYLRHRLLGNRIIECTQIVLNVNDRSSEDIFGYIDNMKFKSSMTLFNIIQNDNDIFHKALMKYYAGNQDILTINILNRFKRRQ
jgi:uncharacterized protein (DUF1810 family)